MLGLRNPLQRPPLPHRHRLHFRQSDFLIDMCGPDAPPEFLVNPVSQFARNDVHFLPHHHIDELFSPGVCHAVDEAVAGATVEDFAIFSMQERHERRFGGRKVNSLEGAAKDKGREEGRSGTWWKRSQDHGADGGCYERKMSITSSSRNLKLISTYVDQLVAIGAPSSGNEPARFGRGSSPSSG